MIPFRAILSGLVLAGALFAVHPAAAGDTRVGDLVIAKAWSRATVGTVRPAVGYLTISNAGAVADRLVAAASPVAARVELHRSVMKGGMMRMEPVDGIDVPAGGRATLAPGGYHLMLVGLKKALKEGMRVPLTLTFAKAGKVEIEMKVMPLGGGMEGHMNMNGH